MIESLFCVISGVGKKTEGRCGKVAIERGRSSSRRAPGRLCQLTAFGRFILLPHGPTLSG